MARGKSLLLQLSSPTKGNDGRAKRRQTIQKVSIVICVTLFFILIFVFTGVRVSNKRNDGSEDDYIARDKLLKKVLKKKNGHQYKKNQDEVNVLSSM